MTDFVLPPSYVRGNEFYSIENEKQVRLKGISSSACILFLYRPLNL